ncbi:MAG: hypothetical protein K2M42_05885 [Oscillospiraceae bacterium]|nr:hypothetical protein [Oscillospiraceae bacterium]
MPIKIERRKPTNRYLKQRSDSLRDHIRPTALLKYVALTVAGILLFRMGQAQALAERGYAALGGEVAALFLPVFYWVIARVVRDTVNHLSGR